MRYYGENIKSAIEHTMSMVTKSGIIEKAGIWQASELFQDLEMYVLRNVQFSVEIPECISCLRDTGADLPWAEDHFQERISGIPSNPGETYKYWPYHSNLDNSEFKDGVFSHTYQERFWPKKAGNYIVKDSKRKGIRYELGDLNDLIQQLKDNPLTRQAYLPIFFPEDTWAASNKKRVPCTLGYYFYIERERLHCNYIIRSCDIFRHFRNDVYLTSRLLQHVAKELGIPTGKVNFSIFNLHLFKNDEYAFRKKESRLERKNL